jgi:WG containing repeat
VKPAVCPILLGISLLSQAACKTGPPTFAFIDRSGPKQAAHSFSERLAAVSLNGKWGFIDESGRFVIPPLFGVVENFSQGLAMVTTASIDHYWERDTLFGYIDRTGKFVIEPRFNWAGSFSEGLASVCVGLCRGSDRILGGVGYIGRDGKFVLPPRYKDAGRFSEGLAVAGTGLGPLAPKGFIDKSGAFVIAPRFIYADEFAEDLAATDQGFINRRGEVVIKAEPLSPGGDFSSGWAAVREGDGPVFINTKGQITLRPDYRGVGPFSEDLAPACPSNCGPSALGFGQNWGFMNKSGKFVIKPQFGYRPEPFHNGLALVCFGCKG